MWGLQRPGLFHEIQIILTCGSESEPKEAVNVDVARGNIIWKNGAYLYSSVPENCTTFAKMFPNTSLPVSFLKLPPVCCLYVINKRYYQNIKVNAKSTQQCSCTSGCNPQAFVVQCSRVWGISSISVVSTCLKPHNHVTQPVLIISIIILAT